jgi:hypothetical protein
MLHVKWVPFHDGMACPQDADGRGCVQIWRVSANILNKQSRIADTGWSCGFGLDVGLTIPDRKNSSLRNIIHGLGLDQWRALVNKVMNLRVP